MAKLQRALIRFPRRELAAMSAHIAIDALPN